MELRQRPLNQGKYEPVMAWLAAVGFGVGLFYVGSWAWRNPDAFTGATPQDEQRLVEVAEAMKPPNGNLRIRRTFYNRSAPRAEVLASYVWPAPSEPLRSYYDRRFQAIGWNRCADGSLFFFPFRKYQHGTSLATLSFGPMRTDPETYSIDFTWGFPNPC
jgi:hypothetical protein